MLASFTCIDTSLDDEFHGTATKCKFSAWIQLQTFHLQIKICHEKTREQATPDPETAFQSHVLLLFGPKVSVVVSSAMFKPKGLGPTGRRTFLRQSGLTPLGGSVT